MTEDFQGNIEPFTPTSAFQEHGQKAVGAGTVAVIALAGGHGSRLGYNAPKGCYPILNKSLYQRLAEKVLHASVASKKELQLGIMTSDATHEATVKHFEDENYFGLKKEQVVFFMQKNLPLQDETGSKLDLTAPDGNGALFWHFEKSGHLAAWEKKGVCHITVFPIDNALADPFEPNLIGLHALHKNDVTVVGISRESQLEHVGVLVEKNGKLGVVEYSEMADSDRLAYKEDGSLKHPLANISYFAFSLAFIKKILTHSPTELPLHIAKKKINNEYLYKLEYFIFDLLAFSDRSEVLLLPRNRCFAPLKTPEDIPLVERALNDIRT